MVDMTNSVPGFIIADFDLQIAMLTLSNCVSDFDIDLGVDVGVDSDLDQSLSQVQSALCWSNA